MSLNLAADCGLGLRTADRDWHITGFKFSQIVDKHEKYASLAIQPEEIAWTPCPLLLPLWQKI